MSGGSLKDITALMARYNLWANTEVTTYFRTVDPLIPNQPISGSFSSINQTIRHIRDAQEVWYLRLHGESLTGFPDAADADHSTGKLYESLISSSQGLVTLESGYSRESLLDKVDYRTFAGIAQTSRRYEVLMHVFNHSMYHRGQCITMARIAGLKNPPSTDLIRFLRIQA